MTGRLALLCSGQGCQGPGMFDLARGDPGAAAQLDGWLEGAGLDAPLSAILPDDRLLFANRHAQPLIVAATLANWTALAQDMPPVAIVAGYSIGELSAYGVAGALTPRDAVVLAGRRARLMDACRDAAPGQALAALSGLSGAALEGLARAAGFHLAIETGADSLVAGGPAAAREALFEAVGAAGGKATLLPVELASHTPFMAAAVAPFGALLDARGLATPRMPVVSGISAERITDPGRAAEHLARQLAEPIRWKDCMDTLLEAGVTVALELGPGSALTRMLGARHPGIACRSVADFRSLDGVRKWLERHVE